MQKKILFHRCGFILGGALALMACRSHPEAVNATYEPPAFPMVIPAGSIEANAMEPREAISGKILLKSEFPAPLSKVTVGLYRFEKESKKLIHEFSSNSDGSFQVTRLVNRGSYELQVTDPRYDGALLVDLDQPVSDLILEVTKR